MALKTQIVVVGGGAGGLELVARLGAKHGRDPRFDIILVERNRTHIWKPLLHEVAAGSLDANQDEVGYRAHASRWGYRYFMGSLEAIDRAAGQIIISPLLDDDGSELMGRHRIRYDFLVLAIGSVDNDYGTPGVLEHCLLLDDRHAADRFRQRLLDHCLRVSRIRSADPAAEAFVDVAIVGGGATGVELAAELYNAAAGLAHYGLEVFDASRLRVTLLEAGPRLLPALPEHLAQAARDELESLGVRVLVDTRVTEVTRAAMHTGSGHTGPGEVIAADLKVWAAGVKGPDLLAGIGGLETNRADQLVVRPTLQTTRDERILAFGDCCSCTPEGAEKPVPPRAQAAHQMAVTVFRNLQHLMRNEPLESYVYRDHGSLVSLSRFSTVGTLMGNLVGGRMAIEGRLARFVYISLYWNHLLAIHGWLRGLTHIAISQINRVIRPRLKLH